MTWVTAITPLLATLIPARPTGSEGPSKWLTRTTRPAPAAAPWERRTIPPVDESDSDSALKGNHTDGVPVADLFARLTGEIPAVLQQHGDTRTGVRQAGSRPAGRCRPADGSRGVGLRVPDSRPGCAAATADLR